MYCIVWTIVNVYVQKMVLEAQGYLNKQIIYDRA